MNFSWAKTYVEKFSWKFSIFKRRVLWTRLGSFKVHMLKPSFPVCAWSGEGVFERWLDLGGRWGRGSHDGISALLRRHTRELAPSLSPMCEDTGRRQWSTSQEEGSPRKPTVQAPWSQMSKRYNRTKFLTSRKEEHRKEICPLFRAYKEGPEKKPMKSWASSRKW